MSARTGNAATALGSLQSLSFVLREPAGTVVPMLKMLNPTNHMRTTNVGAFPLPSVARISPLPPPHIRARDNPRWTTMKQDLDHFDRALLARCTNMLSDCGTSADRSTTARPLDRRSGRTLDDGQSAVELLAMRTTNNGEPAKGDSFATAAIFPPVCLGRRNGAAFGRTEE
jgi:hypothetical protein